MWMLYLLPKNFLSRCVGVLVHLKLPRPLASKLIHIFGSYYKINFDEAEKSHEQYESIGDFFVRRLKPGLRPLAEAFRLHPADSRITQLEKISDQGKLIQAKGKFYSLDQFLDDSSALTRFKNGFFATYYLCPTDYHRVHSPVTGTIKKVIHKPGHLWPVNDWSTDNINDLFSVNERVIVLIDTDQGEVALVMVGATNVGQMSLNLIPELRTNLCSTSESRVWNFDTGHKIKKGDELGAFHMGSTVVMVYSEKHLFSESSSLIFLQKTFLNNSVKVGQKFF